MSYATGIGSPQQPLSSINPAETEVAVKTSASNNVKENSEGPPAKREQSDQASLSSTSGLVSQALAGSDTRSAKVTSLQQAIAAGSYSVSSADVADKIIQSLLD
jgi:negative regulator of flagellin synthesis FlgM